MARVWTPGQAAAIGERSRTLLVSAAAGSGKTATLTERIIRTLTDEGHPGDISRMLIVTFTRASAADLRKKISTALSEEMAKGQRRAHLSRQLLLLPGAQISTIDSFCVGLVRENASRLGLSPAFRLADAAENRLLLESVMNHLIEEGYEGSAAEFTGGEPFCALADCLSGTRGDSELGELLLALYTKTQGFARSYYIISDIAGELRAACDQPPLETKWGAYLAARARDEIESGIAAYTEAIASLSGNEHTAAAYLPGFEEDLSALRAIRAALEGGDYTRTREALLAFQPAKVKPLRAEKKTEESIRAQEMRKALSKTIKRLGARSFAYGEQEWAPMLRGLSEKLSLLGELLIAFGDRAAAEKKRRGLCDFNDIAHAALRLLYTEAGEKTPLCREIAARFDYVYIDEYQDVNEVQHRLFEALSQPRGRFMVGDVKQSIYGFRGAQPDIFAAIRAAFPALAEAGEEDTAACLSLSANFRSTAPVLAFVNLVFGGLMQGVGDHIGYREEDALVPGLGTDPHAPRVTVALLEQAKTETEEEEAEEEENESETPDEEPDAPDDEACYVATEIERLLREGLEDGTRLMPGDIAILTRTGAAGQRFAAALSARGIRVDRQADRRFFLNPEILLAISLLNVIDNPRRDVYLAGLLRSPLYGFDLDDLIRVRREDESGGTLYEALLSYNANHLDFEKGARFIAELDELREMAEGMPVDRLIWQLYRRTGLLSLAGADKTGSPEARRGNLMLLYDYARRFEQSSFRGLYNFIDYLNEVIARDQSIDEGRVQSDRADTVRVMTIHQSKGLEFPVCFLCGAGKRFRLQDAQGALLFERSLGCAMQLRDESGLARVRNPVYHAIAERITEKQLEEEMRILYVALTRPMRKLYVTATLKDIEAARKTGRERHLRLGATEVYACHSYAEMVLATAADDPSYDLIFPQNGANDGTRVSQDAPQDEQEALSPTAIATAEAVLRERFSYEYPDRHVGALPSKLSVSRLYPALLDEEEQAVPTLSVASEAEGGEEEPGFKPAPLPVFLGGEREDAAARAGTATHLFMQFCDFTRLRDGGAEKELARLREGQFLSAEDAALVRLDEIEAFRRSPMLRALCGGGRVWRELRFHVHLPAYAFTADPEKKSSLADRRVLVQGVMDVVLEREDGSLWLIDYKTDRLSYGERKDPAVAARRLCERHGLQLSYYAAACRQIFGRLPDRVLIYSLHLGDAVSLPPSSLSLPE